jgi:hypothetical protein
VEKVEKGAAGMPFQEMSNMAHGFPQFFGTAGFIEKGLSGISGDAPLPDSRAVVQSSTNMIALLIHVRARRELVSMTNDATMRDSG